MKGKWRKEDFFNLKGGFSAPVQGNILGWESELSLAVERQGQLVLVQGLLLGENDVKEFHGAF